MQTLWPVNVAAMSPAGVADAYDWPPSGIWVRALMLSTADGAARADSGLSGGISSAGDRLVFATIRGMSDAILVGAETIRQEGYRGMRARPELAARREREGQASAPRIVIITRSGDLDPNAPVLTESELPPIVFAPAALPADKHARLSQVCEVVTLGQQDVPLGAALSHLADLGLHRVVCEGGPSLLGQMAAEGLVDEVCLTITPLLSGGRFGNGERTPRILDGAVLPNSPASMRLVHVLEDAGTLFLRYAIQEAGQAEQSAPAAPTEQAEPAARATLPSID